MAGRNIRPYRFNPRGVVDALDGGQVSEGGCSALTNLIFDPANPFTMQCRPAATEESTFSGITGADFVSVAFVVGDIAYGMIKSSTVATYDQPFAYNLATNALVTVSGTQSSATLPLSQAATGTWTPPTMSLVGTLLYVTHPGFIGGSSAFFGWFDTSSPAAPSWNAGNTSGTPLPSVPTAVMQFNNRAWFALGNTLAFTDALTTAISDASHFLTITDSEPITALAQQSLTTAVQGIIQALLAFKENTITFITGDAVDGTLATNTSPVGTGTKAARTVASTPKGVMFMAADGVRIVATDGTIGDPYPDLRIPFIYALTPSRASASYNNNIYRITVQNGHANGNPYEEYWYDFVKNGFTGPHTFVQDMVAPYSGSFVAFTHTIVPALFLSDVVQSGTSIFIEDDEDMAFLLRTAPMQDDGGMYEGSAVLCVIDMQVPQAAQTYNFAAIDVNNGVLSTAVIGFSASGAIWNGFNWGTGIWTATSYGLERYNIPWRNPLVFSRLVFQITGAAVLNFKVGKLTIGNEPLQYVRNLV